MRFVARYGFAVQLCIRNKMYDLRYCVRIVAI